MVQTPDKRRARNSKITQKLSSVFAICIINVAIFLLVGSCVVYRAIVLSNPETMVFVKPQNKPTPPPKPPSKGGEASKSLIDPNTLVVPPTAPPPTVIASTASSSIKFTAEMPIASSSMMSPSLMPPSSSGLAQGTTGGGPSSSNPFGESLSSGVAGLVGDFYDLKQNADGTPTPMGIYPPEGEGFFTTGIGWGRLPATLKHADFLRDYLRDWDQSKLDPFYKAPGQLVTTQIFIPIHPSVEAPKAFGVDGKVIAKRWIVHYHGTIVPPKTGRFRFIGFGDDYLAVRIGDSNALLAGWPGAAVESLDPQGNVNSRDNDVPGPGKFHMICGKWIDFEQGVDTSMDVLIGEGPGGQSGFILLIEEEGDTSAKGDYPVFQVAPTAVPKSNYCPDVFTGKTMVFPVK